MGQQGGDEFEGRVQTLEDQTALAVERLMTWFDRTARDLPWRKTQDPYAVWISEVMLQQTQVQTVIPYWTRWMDRLPTIRDLAEAPPESVLKLWEGLGYYSRARNLQRAAREILERHGGVFPGDAATLLSLPGIGPYTAGAIASIALDQPEPILDGNVMRVLTRVLALEGDPRAKTLNGRLWSWAARLVQTAHTTEKLGRRRCSRLNQALMELGAMVCTPGARPDCARCPLSEICEARRSGTPERFPELPSRVAITPRYHATAILKHQERYLLRLREGTEVNRGFWEFPNWEIEAGDNPETVLGSRLGIAPNAWTALPDLRHHITRYRITQRIRLADHLPSSDLTAGTWHWATPAELRALPMTAAHRKLARRLEPEPGKSPQLS